jgi:hypothetical protein
LFSLRQRAISAEERSLCGSGCQARRSRLAFSCVDASWWLSWDGGILGLLVGVVGLAATFVLLERKTLTYLSETVHLIGTPTSTFPKSVEVTFEGQQVPNLSRTNVFIWNSGNATIRSDDIAQKDPLQLVFLDQAEALDVRVIKASREVFQFELGPFGEDGDSSIQFDFLDPDDGVAIEILHTGWSVEAHVMGTIKGARSRIKQGPSFQDELRRFRWHVLGVALSAVVIFLIFGRSFLLAPKDTLTRHPLLLSIPMLIVSIYTIAAIAMSVRVRTRTYPASIKVD